MMKKFILLVEDDTKFRESLRELLELKSYNVIETKNGKDALSIIQDEAVDLVITDILMPEVNGVYLAFKIRRLKPHLKLIGMTGGEQKGSVNYISMCPPDAFEALLLKPFSSKDLLAQIETTLSLQVD